MPSPHDLRAALAIAANLFTRLGRDDLLQYTAEVEGRLRAGRLSVALIGQFKRGKTSLLNALLHEELLPTGVLPLTAIVTRVQGGEVVRACVRFQDGTEREIPTSELPDYATEAGNPKNERKVRDIVLTHPAPLLLGGIELVDTPGIGSVWSHNTEVATQYLPWVDVALFVVSPDPPITDVERQFLQEARQHAGKILFVLTKADLLSPSDLETVRAFVQDVAHATLGTRVPLLTTSVREGASTGVDQLAAHLATLAGSDREALAEQMAARRLTGALERLRFDFELQLAALRTPHQLRAQRRAVLDQRLQGFAAALLTYSGAWESAFRQVTQSFDERIAQHQGAILSAVSARIEELLHQGQHPRAVYAAAAEDATGLAQARLEQLREDLRRIAREILEEESRPLGGQIEGWINQFAKDAAQLFDLPAVRVDLPLEVAESRGFTFKWQEDFSILPSLAVPAAVTLLPQARAMDAARSALYRRMSEFVDRNTGRLHYHFHESMKSLWRDLWHSTEEMLRTFERSVRQAADALAGEDPASDAAAAACEADLREVADVGLLLQMDQPS